MFIQDANSLCSLYFSPLCAYTAKPVGGISGGGGSPTSKCDSCYAYQLSSDILEGGVLSKGRKVAFLGKGVVGFHDGVVNVVAAFTV